MIKIMIMIIAPLQMRKPRPGRLKCFLWEQSGDYWWQQDVSSVLDSENHLVPLNTLASRFSYFLKESLESFGKVACSMPSRIFQSNLKEYIFTQKTRIAWGRSETDTELIQL